MQYIHCVCFLLCGSGGYGMSEVLTPIICLNNLLSQLQDFEKSNKCWLLEVPAQTTLIKPNQILLNGIHFSFVGEGPQQCENKDESHGAIVLFAICIV